MGDKDAAGRAILRGARATALGFIFRFGARLVFLFVAARLFGATIFGAYVLAAAIVELAVSIGALSTKKTLFPLLDRHVADGDRSPGHVVVDAALLVTLASLALAASLMILVLVLPVDWVPPATETSLFLLAPMIAGQALLDLFLAAARWKQTVRYEVVSRSLIEPYAATLGTIAAWAAGLQTTGLLVGYWCGTLAALAYAAHGARLSLGGLGLAQYRPSRNVMRTILASAGSNSAVDLLNALYSRIDLYMVGLLLGEGATGIYGMARQVTTPIRQVRQSFDGLLIPAVARTLALRGSRETGEALASATRLILVIQLPILIGLVAVGSALMEALGRGFSAGYWALLALAGAEVIQAAFSMGDLIFVYLKPRIGLKITVAGIVLGVAVAALLIPWLGITGAALAVLVAYTFRAWLRVRVLGSRFDLHVPAARHAGPLLASALGCAAAVAIHRLTGLSPRRFDALALIGGLAVYSAGIAIWLRARGERLSLSGFDSHKSGA
jgi:O-antigen/teichoic acid export membrane protein